MQGEKITAKEIKQLLQTDALALQGNRLTMKLMAIPVLLSVVVCLWECCMVLVSGDRMAWFNFGIDVAKLGLIMLLSFLLIQYGKKGILYYFLVTGAFGLITLFRDGFTLLPPNTVFFFYSWIFFLSMVAFLVCSIVLLNLRASKRYYAVCKKKSLYSL